MDVEIEINNCGVCTKTPSHLHLIQQKIALANTAIQSTFASHSLIKFNIFYGIRRNSVR